MENYEVAFGNEVARMISLCSIIESNSYLRFPKSKQTESWFTFGYPMGCYCLEDGQSPTV